MSGQTAAGADALNVELIRGAVVESVHQVSLAMVDVHGDILLAFGDMEQPVYMRSSAKPFQALPFVESGYVDQYRLTPQQLALVCASHSGTDLHAEIVRELLERNGLSEDNLQCGTHTPSDRTTASRLARTGEAPSSLRHNCSGKHTGMLLYTQSVGEAIDQYLQPSSGVQQAILNAFCEMVGVAEREVVVGVDGCSAPNFAVPLTAAALGYARLMEPSGLGKQRAQACDRIVQAMSANPEMVAGVGKFDTELMRAVKGRLLAKGGAEGYQAVGVPANMLPRRRSAGLILKVHDGDTTRRGLDLATLVALQTLALITAEERAGLAAFDERQLFNYMNRPVGEIRLAQESRRRLRDAYERI